jgi:hypothetical protein
VRGRYAKSFLKSIEKKLEIMINYANELSKALELVINNHLEENRLMILEDDFISPELSWRYNNWIKEQMDSGNARMLYDRMD